MLNIISFYCDWRLYFSIYICIGRALSSPKTPHQVLKIRNPKTTNLDIDDKYTRRLCWITFTFMLHVWFSHRVNILKELTPAVRYQTICTKIKVSPPLRLQPPCAPPAGIPLSFWCYWRKVKGTSFLERFLVSSPPPRRNFYFCANCLISNSWSQFFEGVFSKYGGLLRIMTGCENWTRSRKVKVIQPAQSSSIFVVNV